MVKLKRTSTVSLVAVLLLICGSSGADPIQMIDLRSLTEGGSDQGTINAGLGSVTFAVDQLQPSGTGVLYPFVRIQRKDDEQGYNTTQPNAGALPFDEKFSIYTHDLLIGDLETNAAGTLYQFVLDIGEPKDGTSSLLSLDGVKLFSTSTPGQNGNLVDLMGNWVGPTDATLLWDMDTKAANGAYQDNWVLLDANRDGNPPGNGVSDMRMDVPVAIIDAAPSTQEYFILWSRFGLNESYVTGSGSFGTFEEWAQIAGADGGGGPPAGIPIPAPLALLGAGMALLGWVKRGSRA